MSVVRTDGPLVYLDASAAVKLITAEPESDALWRLVRQGHPGSSELVLAEVARAVRRLAHERSGDADEILRQMASILRSFSLIAVDREILSLAGSFEAPYLRALDAIHVATAIAVASEIDWFVSYDRRQAEAAAAAGFEIAQPGR